MEQKQPFTQQEWEQTPKAVKDFFLSAIARLEDTIEKQQRTVEKQQRTIEKQQRTIETQQQTIEGLEARVKELEERIKLNSSNSSKPPSSDFSKSKKKTNKAKGRKRGAQQGHKGKARSLLPVEQVDEIVSCVPSSCSNCEHPFTDQKDQAPLRHQVTEIPPLKPEVIEYQVHCLTCPVCQEKTRASLPEGVTYSAFGPRLQAMVSLCVGVYFISRRAVVQLMKDFFGVVLSVGSVSNLEKKTSEAFAVPVAEAHEYVKQSDACNVDETGFRENKKKAWLWVAVTQFVVVFLISVSRSKASCQDLIGKEYCII